MPAKHQGLPIPKYHIIQLIPASALMNLLALILTRMFPAFLTIHHIITQISALRHLIFESDTATLFSW